MLNSLQPYSLLQKIFLNQLQSCSNNLHLILIYDNFDSFTYNLVDLLRQMGSEIEVVRNNVPINDIIELPIDGIVLSPGPEIPDKSGNLMELITNFHNKLPIQLAFIPLKRLCDYGDR